MPRFAALLVLLLSLASPPGALAGSDDDVIDGFIDGFIDTEMSAADIPGLAYAVVTDGEISTVAARGVQKAGTDAAVTPDTPFVTGSISKSFTALAVMQLVEAGEVDLEGGISDYLAGFSGQPAAAVTIRQLLSHTSGFSTFQGNESHAGATSTDDELAGVVGELASTAPAHAPGSHWQYSNANYQILGRLIEVVTGQSYQAYVGGNILEPIGMDHSFVADGDVHPAMAMGHSPWFGSTRSLGIQTTQRATAPQGGIISTSSDLALYMQMMMNNQNDVLSAEGKAMMLQPASETSPDYGFGWYLDSDNDRAWHSGSSPGFETLLTLLPGENAGVVVLVNRGSGMGFGETAQIRNRITASALGLDYDGEGSRWSQKAVFVSLGLLPFVYVLSMIWAWRRRDQIRAKRADMAGRFSLWFPLLTTGIAAWVLLSLVPKLFHAPLRTIAIFQPDLGVAVIATAVCGVLWATLRLAVAYIGRPTEAPVGTTPRPAARPTIRHFGP